MLWPPTTPGMKDMGETDEKEVRRPKDTRKEQAGGGVRKWGKVDGISCGVDSLFLRVE